MVAKKVKKLRMAVWKNSPLMQILSMVENSICSGPVHVSQLRAALGHTSVQVPWKIAEKKVLLFCMSMHILSMSRNLILT